MFCDILSSFHEIMKLQNPEFDVGDVSPRMDVMFCPFCCWWCCCFVFSYFC